MPARYVCERCAFSASVKVRTSGLGSANFGDSAKAQERAYESMIATAQIRMELTPCPKCGARSSRLLVRAFLKTVLLLWLVPIFVVVLMAITSRDFSQDAFVVIVSCGGLALAMALWAAIHFGLEYRRAKGAVTFDQA
jgi:hypothetical protein